MLGGVCTPGGAEGLQLWRGVSGGGGQEQCPVLIFPFFVCLWLPGQHQLVAGSRENQERGARPDLEEIGAVGNHRAALQ